MCPQESPVYISEYQLCSCMLQPPFSNGVDDGTSTMNATWETPFVVAIRELGCVFLVDLPFAWQDAAPRPTAG
eukprot:8087083-Pyramimonas_sp.AAC.1